MNENGHVKPSQDVPDAKCPFCGIPANSDSDHAVVEFQAGQTPQDISCWVWHRGCYDEFFDQKEET
ncbi:MAG: hypothetical protein U0236_03740 [Nitrospira sp.]